MPPTKPDDHELRNVFVLARELCVNGKANVTRKERLLLALVELRDRIRKEFLKVAKDWQVSAQDLRRDYSYAYPVPAPGAPDVLCLEQACEGLIVDLRCEIQNYAEQYGVPDDLLEAMLVDWLVSDQMGKQRAPSAFFIPEEQERSVIAPTNKAGPPVDRLPLVKDLLMGRASETAADRTGHEG